MPGFSTKLVRLLEAQCKVTDSPFLTLKLLAEKPKYGDGMLAPEVTVMVAESWVKLPSVARILKLPTLLIWTPESVPAPAVKLILLTLKPVVTELVLVSIKLSVTLPLYDGVG